MAQKGQKMAVTIKDVAKQAGVSTATVSKVMNGSYSISQETIDRVKKVMQELDYHPNLRARNFVTQCLCDLAGEECRICQPAYV